MVEQLDANIKIADAKLKADEKTNTIDKPSWNSSSRKSTNA